MKAKNAHQRTVLLLATLKSIKDQRGMSAEAVRDSLNEYLHTDNRVSTATVAKWLDGSITSIQSESALAIQEWIEDNRQ